MKLKNYPKNWPEISKQVKDAAGWRCQNPECGLQFDIGNNVLILQGKLITYTVHHKDGNPFNCQPENLIALCSPCHCRVQWPLIRQKMREKKSVNQEDLFK